MVPASRLFSLRAEVAELADALASGASGRKVVEVQILSSAPFDSPAALPSASRQARSWQANLMSNALSERSESKGLVFLPYPSHRRRMPFVYVVRCTDRSLYVGWTSDVEARVAMHNDGRGGTYTRGRRPVTLVFTEAHTTMASAISRERQIKHWSAAKKEALVAGDSAERSEKNW